MIHKIIFAVLFLLSTSPIVMAGGQDDNEMRPKKIISKHAFFDFAEVPEKEDFVKKLYHLYQTIFTGTDYNSFRDDVYDKTAAAVFVHVMKNEEEEWVGFALVRRFMINYPEQESADQDIFAVFRGLSLILPGYRGQDYQTVNLPVLAMEKFMDEYHQKNPNTNMVVFSSLLRPESLILMSKRSPEATYPSPLRETPPAVQAFMVYLRDLFHRKPAENPSPFAIQYHVTSGLTDHESEKFEASESPYVKYFKDITGLKEGIGIMGLSLRFLVPRNPLGLEPTKTYESLYSKL